MGICEECPYLLVGLRLRAASHDSAMGLEDLVPFIHLCIRWLVRAEVRTPPVRKALKPCTFSRCQTADDIVRLDNTILITGIRAVHQCGGLFLGHSHALRLHLRIEAIRLIVDERRVFIIGCHQGICHLFCGFGEEGCLGSTVGRCRNSSRTFGYHGRLNFLFHGKAELGVLSLVEGCAVDAVSHTVLFRSIQRIHDLGLFITVTSVGRT